MVDSRAMRKLLIATMALLMLTACQGAGADETAAVQKVVTDYHAAVKSGDATAAMKDFADDAMMLEAGVVETRQQYQDSHLPADIDFEKTVNNTVKTLKLTLEGNTAWVASSMDLKGTFQERDVDVEALELMVLSKQSNAWKIRSIAWNSRRR